MGVVTRENEGSSIIPAAKMFKVFLLDAPINMPKILPHAIKSIDTVEGDGGPGSVVKTTFADGTEFKYVKNKIDLIDKEKLIYNYTAIEGEPWMEGIDKISYETKFLTSPNGGSIFKSIINYYPKGDSKLDLDKLKAAEDQAMAMFKVVEAHVLANPDAY